MSRIAKDPVIVPEGVTINIVENLIELKGSKGELSINVHDSINFEMKDNQIIVNWSKDEHRAMAGTMRSLINNCVIGVSGGTDSSYLVHLAKTWGLKPLAVHYDNTWNSAIATMNLYKILNALNVDLYTKVVANKEVDVDTEAYGFNNIRHSILKKRTEKEVKISVLEY